jgi:prolipoprotein diacylglyceryltransferase
MSLDAPLLLTAVGLMAAAFVARRRAIRFGLELQDLYSLTRWLLVGLVVGGHLMEVLYYVFDQEPVKWRVVWRQPLELLRLWHGWRSVGGVFGGLAATLAWRHYRFESTVMLRWPGWFAIEGYWFVKRVERVPLLALADVVLSVFPLAWALHLAGSVLVHDRPDIGVFDLLITTVLLVLVMVLWKGSFRAGFYVCLVGLTYAPARVAIGFLAQRASGAPVVVGGLTLTQWGFAIAALMSLGLLVRLHWASLSARLGAS